MLTWFKKWLARYDDWCQSMGLTPDQKRCCVPYRKDPIHDKEPNHDKAPSHGKDIEKS